MDVADEIWNRAAMAGGGPRPGQGDAALASVLGVHSMAMSAGLIDAVERSAPVDLDAAEAGYRWLGLGAAGDLVASVRREIEAGALDDDDRADALEERAGDEYGLIVPTDRTLGDAFRARFAEMPQLFAPV